MFRYDVSIPVRVCNALELTNLADFDRLLSSEEATVEKQEFVFALIHAMNQANTEYTKRQIEKGVALPDPEILEFVDITTSKPEELNKLYSDCLEVLKAELEQLPKEDSEKKN